MGGDRSSKCGGETAQAPIPYSQFLQATYGTFVFSIRILWEEGPATVERLAQALASPEIQHQLAFAFQRELLNLQLKQPQLPPSEIYRSSLASTGRLLVSHHLLPLLRKDPTLRRLEASWKEVEQKLRRTPAGLWIDEHQTVVYAVGTVVLLGGGLAMYSLRRGDPIARYASRLVRLKWKPLGSLKIGMGMTRFVPSQQLVGGYVRIEGGWQPLPLDLKISGLVMPGGRRLSLDGTVWWKRDFPLSLGGHLQLDSSGDWRYRLGLGFRQRQDGLSLDLRAAVQDGPTLDLGVGVGYRGSSGWSRYSLQLGVGYTAPLSTPSEGRPTVAVLLRLDF